MLNRSTGRHIPFANVQTILHICIKAAFRQGAVRRRIPARYLITFFLLITNPARCQINEPEFIRDALYVAENGEIVSIPSSPASFTAIFSVVADGDAAKTRIPKSEEIHIIIKANNCDDTPGEVFKAFKLKQKTNRRTASMGAMGIKSKDMIPFKAKSFGKNCYELIFTGLESGEYGIWYAPGLDGAMMGEHQMTFFGVE